MPVPSNPALRVETPRCDENHPKTRTSVERKTCPKCRARDAYVRAKRLDDLKAGKRKVGERPVTTVVVRAPRCRKHRTHRQAGCEACKAWARYLSAGRRLAVATGTLERAVDPAIVQAHLRSLIDKQTGGWSPREVAEVSGLSQGTVNAIARGARTGPILPATWAAVRDLKPKGVPRARRSDLVDATEARRIVQGLNRQGWSLAHMGSLVGHSCKRSIQRLANGESVWILPTHLEEIRSLRDKLGEYDLVDQVRPLPGMKVRSARSAEANGYQPLSAWTAATIGDPNARPYSFQRQEPDELGYPRTDGVAFIDPLLLSRVRAAAQQLDDLDTGRLDDAERRAHAHIDPIGRVTRLEAHAVTLAATDAGMSSTEIGKLLGYPSATKQQREAGERQVARMRATLKDVKAWLDSDPQGQQVPDWYLTARPARGGRRDLGKLLPALLAVQVPPYGPGWTVEELAARCRVPANEMLDFLVWASKDEGDRLWQPQSRRRRTRVTGACAPASQETIAA